MGQWLSLLLCLLLLLKAEGVAVPITFVQSAVAKGAGEKFLLCLMIRNMNICVLHIMFTILSAFLYWFPN